MEVFFYFELPVSPTESNNIWDWKTDLWPNSGLLTLKLMQEKNNCSVGVLKTDTSCYAYSLHVHSWAWAASSSPNILFPKKKPGQATSSIFLVHCLSSHGK